MLVRIKKSFRWKEIKIIEYNNTLYKVYDKIKVYVSTYGDIKKIYSNGKEIISRGYGKSYKRITITCVDSSNNKIKLELLIHRLVAYAFLEKKEYHTDVNHKDGNPSNNFLTNLEWVTHSENVIHAINTGLTPTILDIDGVLEISKLLIDGYKDSKISEIMSNKGYLCTPSMVFRIRNKDNWIRITKDFIFPKNKPHKQKDKKLAKNIYSMINKGYSNKEIIKKLKLNDIFPKKSTINSYLYKFRHKEVWKELL